MPAELQRDAIEATVQAVADRLPGDWLLVGGALVALWLDARRTTEDIDLVPFPGSGAERMSLLGLAHDLGLPVEALNSAADFFVERIPDWRADVALLRSGTRGRIFRPTPTLFLLLKLGRLSTLDLEDCRAVLQAAAAANLPVDLDRVAAALAALPPPEDDDLGRRREALAAALASHSASRDGPR